MSGRLNGKVGIVTGAGRGIGRAIARKLAAEGMQTALLARTEEELHETADLIAGDGGDGKAMVLAADVTDFAGLQRAVELVLSAWDRVDLLVNNAGVLNAIGPLWETEPEDWRNDVDVNVYGVYAACRAVLPVMLERGAGRIVNMAGGGAGGPFPFVSAYAAGKSAVTRLTENLAVELDALERPVRVFALTPGFIRTEMTEQFERTDAGRRWMDFMVERFEKGDDTSPEHAAAVVAAVAAGELDAFHGRFLNAPQDAPRLRELAAAGGGPDGEARTLRIRQD